MSRTSRTIRSRVTTSPDEPHASAPPLVGIEIGGTKLQLVVGDAAGVILRRWRAVVDRGGGGPGICRQISAGLGELMNSVAIPGSPSPHPAAIGVGFGGPVDWRTGRVKCSHQIDGWDDFDLAGWLSETAGGAPVAVENDANVGALGESARGAGANGEEADPLFFTTLGSGVGGGLVVGGAIYHGAPPGEAEFGHLRLDRAGATVESRCSGWAVDATIRRLARERPGSLLARAGDGNSGGGGEARHLAAALAAGDDLARRVLDELAGDLGFAYSHVVHLFHPRMIVLGGGLALVGEPLRAAVADALSSHVMAAFRPGPAVRVTALGEDAIPVGALVLAGQRAAGGGV